jgi:hypothetical protein
MIKKNIFLIFIIIGVIIIVIIQLYLNKKNIDKNQAECRIENDKEIGGIVIRSYFDEHQNHKGFVIELTNGKSYRPLFLKKWQAINLYEGDSIYKKGGTFKVVIYKNGDVNPQIIEDTVNCDEIK